MQPFRAQTRGIGEFRGGEVLASAGAGEIMGRNQAEAIVHRKGGPMARGTPESGRGLAFRPWLVLPLAGLLVIAAAGCPWEAERARRAEEAALAERDRA